MSERTSSTVFDVRPLGGLKYRGSRHRVEEALRAGDLPHDAVVRDPLQMGMGHGVVGDLVPLGDDAPDQCGMPARGVPDDEECGFSLVLLEDVEDIGGEPGVWAVVDRQDHLLAGDPGEAVKGVVLEYQAGQPGVKEQTDS